MRSSNQLKMFRTVVTAFSDYPADWGTMPALQAAITRLTTKTIGLEQLAWHHGNSKIGVRALKDQEREDAIGTALTVVSGLKALASETNDSALKEQARISRTNLQQASVVRLSQYFIRILEAANQHAAGLATNGVSQQTIDEFAAVSGHIAEVLGTTRTAVVNKSQETTAIKELRKEISNLLRNTIDNQVNVLRTSHPDFYKLYKSARVIVDHKGPTKGNGNPPVTDPGLPVPPTK